MSADVSWVMVPSGRSSSVSKLPRRMCSAARSMPATNTLAALKDTPEVP
jgi:hypothetical protein